jgi:hypothetical protein
MMRRPQNSPQLTPQEAQDKALALRRKVGTWVEWAEACQALQQSGWSTQQIFEETGFEPIHQNQIIVAAQVYASLVQVGLSAAAQAHFGHRASDVLYEFRILSPQERLAAAEFALERNLDMDGARDLAKAMKDFSRISQPPAEFSSHPGDVMAYFAWRSAKQTSDLQARSLLIAKGLRFARTEAARQQIEGLLTDFTATPTRSAPRLPVYRLESDEELPRVLPVVGKLPLSVADLQAVPFLPPEHPFGLVHFGGERAWVAVPSWQVVRSAEDPVVLLCQSDQLPTRLPGKVEEVLVIVDRSQRQWDAASYFAVAATDDRLELRWFETIPSLPLQGRVILVMRPKKILDEAYTEELWQWDE